MLRVHAYIRYSSVMQDDGFSVEYQIAEIEEYCKKHGLTLEKVHIDQAQTATKVAGREAFWEMLSCVTNDEVDIVIVYKMNRMFRNAEESHVYRKKFRKHGVKIASVTEPIDDQTSAGRFMINTLANIDQYQSESISDFVRSTLREMTRQGYYIGGTLPLGLTTVNENHGKKIRKRYEIVESEAVHVRKCFELYADGYSLRYILDYLFRAGIRGRRGKAVGSTTLRRLLENDIYIGNLRFSTEGYPDLIAEGVITPILDAETWERVQQRKRSDKPVQPRKHRELYPLTGKIKCGYCGAHFFGVSNKITKTDGTVKYYKYYICSAKRTVHGCGSRKLRKDFIENAAIKAIGENILNAEAIKKIAQEVATMSADQPKKIEAEKKSIRKQIEKLDARLDLFIEMRQKKEMSPETLRRKSADVENEMHELKKALADLDKKTATAILPVDVENYLYGMMKKLTSDDMDVVKVLYENFIDEIIVTDDSIEIRLFSCPIMYKETNGHSCGSLYTKIYR